MRIGNASYFEDDTFDEITLAPGFITSVRVERLFQRQLAKPYSNCDISETYVDEYALSSHLYKQIEESAYEYTQQLCLFQCYQIELARECNCTDPWFISLVPDLDVCVTNAETDCLVRVYNQVYLLSSFVRDSCLPLCPLECDRNQYKYVVTMSRLDATWYVDLTATRANLSADFLGSNIDAESVRESSVAVNVFYDSLSYTFSTESAKCDVVSLLASIGGSLGLFMGVSVLSLVEILQLLIEICLMRVYRAS